jgi:hypothetical protein
MAKFEKFLFFYSILAITVLLISFGLFEPTPLNFISVVLLAPACFYFWVRLTNPEKVSAEKWSLRFLISLTVLSALGIGSFYLTKQSFIQPQEIETKETATPATVPIVTPTPQTSPKSKTQGESVTDLVFGTPIPLKEITGKAGIKTIDVYESPIQASKKIANIDGSIKYLYLTKQGNWYNIVLSESEAGWVSTSQVQEVQ